MKRLISALMLTMFLAVSASGAEAGKSFFEEMKDVGKKAKKDIKKADKEIKQTGKKAKKDIKKLDKETEKGFKNALKRFRNRMSSAWQKTRKAMSNFWKSVLDFFGLGDSRESR